MIPRKKKNYDIKYYSESDINCIDCTLDKIQRISSYLHKNNAEMYKIYLACRPDLGETVKDYYLDLILKLEENEKIKIENAIIFLEDKQY
jgi:hypothetical protein